jgi:SAM-dependent methyltransferase
MSAVETYTARVDAVLEQRTRLRGPAPPGDLFGGLAPDHPLITADPRRPLDGSLEIIASYLKPDDTIVDVGGGAGRNGLLLALRCRGVVNVDPSARMLRAFEEHARRAGIANARAVLGDWLEVDPPQGTLALVNHVAYLTRDIATFVEKLEAAASRRVVMTVGSPPPPSRNRPVFQVCYDEPSERVPGHRELVNVLWELGIEPDVLMLPVTPSTLAAVESHEQAIKLALDQLRGHQWAFWPLAPELERQARQRIEAHFGDLFEQAPEGFRPRWASPAREVLITWPTRQDRQAAAADS